MAEKSREIAKNDRRRGGIKSAVVRVIAVIISGASLALMVGFLYFLGEIDAADHATPVRADAIVVFSGEPRRIRVATDLLIERFSTHLIIIGQDNADEIERMRGDHSFLFKCCVVVDQRSRNTSEDAKLARDILNKSNSHSVLLVTSSFHMPRAQRELHKQLPDVTIIPYGVVDDQYSIKQIFKDPEIRSKFVSQYLLYVATWIPGGRTLLEENRAREILISVSNTGNVALAILAVVIALIAGVAFSQHRRQR